MRVCFATRNGLLTENAFAGTWGACALLVSYLWGVLLFGNAMGSVFLSVVAVFLLLAGGAGIALCEVIASRLCGRSKGGDLEQQCVGAPLKCVPTLLTAVLLRRDHLLPGNPTTDPESGPTSSHSLGVEKFDRPRRNSSVFLVRGHLGASARGSC